MDYYITSSRKELFGNSEAAGSSLPADPTELAVFDDALKAQLDVPIVPDSEEKLKSTKKSKKRRHVADAVQVEPVFEFKLVSGSSQPQSISLQEPAALAGILNPHVYEDTTEEEDQRRQRVSGIAVDTSWLLKEASTNWASPKPHKQPVEVKVDVKGDTIPSLFVVERQRWPLKPNERSSVAAKANVQKIRVK
ncbi:hypothetical protein DACRYDRAFT_104832 [Dacryopinax primogenitus]|uniref:Uncharacterized protein n=1 Tax=Dacryopinax primogenitus (strain DJM 731) TaxID=1858805 RepID=M5G846_DACPD|nr:uncharacterized protein DACRYDRAFT_104832 [Dacryopinax primogenitus]EJU04939.1 hypothetical protein DACRYDRAFT_104832 [Dacryopinax primogenitus]